VSFASQRVHTTHNHLYNSPRSSSHSSLSADKKGRTFGESDLLGTATVDVAALIAAPIDSTQTFAVLSKKDKQLNSGKATVNACVCECVDEADSANMRSVKTIAETEKILETAPDTLAVAAVGEGKPIRLKLACRSLPKTDTFSKADPLIAVYERDQLTRAWRYIGQTESINNEDNPDFGKLFFLTHYNVQPPQELKFDIYDFDSTEIIEKMSKDDLISSVTVKFDDLSPGSQDATTLPLKDSNGNQLVGKDKQPSSIVIDAAPPATASSEGKEEGTFVTLNLACKNLKRNDTLSKSDPIVLVYERDNKMQWTLKGQTESIDNDSNPKFKTPVVLTRFADDAEQTIKFEVYDVDDDKQVRSATVAMRRHFVLFFVVGLLLLRYIVQPSPCDVTRPFRVAPKREHKVHFRLFYVQCQHCR
jgi:hypothetical protein